MTSVVHLTRRFFTSLSPAAPAAADDDWVRTVLASGEYALWSRMANHDRRHSIVVARRVERMLAGSDFDGDPQWLAAALLHDVGKVESGLGVLGRVGATLVGAAGGRRHAADWSDRRGVRRRIGLYLRHPELGGADIRGAGGREAAARWAAAHHDGHAWAATGIPEPVIAALHDADDD
jgi:hypothetical protein